MQVEVKAKLWSSADEQRVRSGRMRPLEVDALVDTGSTEVVLPPEIGDRLKSIPFERRSVLMADGRRVTVTRCGGVRLGLQGRMTEVTVLVVPGAPRVLIGHVALELMDFMVDVPKGRIIGRHPEGELHELRSVDCRAGSLEAESMGRLPRRSAPSATAPSGS